MDPGIGVWLEIVVFGALLYFLMYFMVSRGSVARKVRGRALEAMEARKGEVGEQDERDHQKT